MVRSSVRPRFATAAALVLIATVIPTGAASAATTIDGPIDLGASAAFSVLAASTVTNTGPSVLGGDVGLSPGTSITGFPPAVVNGTVHNTDAVATQAQIDLTTAYGVAASLTPIRSGLGDLTGLSLSPGVYAGGELSVTGALTLAGSAESVWVFQAASTLDIGAGALITVTGGASACNVFWQVGSSATLEPAASLVGTVMANESITAKTAATITGRLLARTAAVTLDTNTITTPSGCDERPGTVTSSPVITSPTPPEGSVGGDYSHTVTATGSPSPSFVVSRGVLPPGIALDAVTGVMAGQPTTSGVFEFDVTVSNGAAPDSTVTYSLTIASPAAEAPSAEATPGASGETAPIGPQLAASGMALGPVPLIAAVLMLFGVLLMLLTRRRTSARASI